MNKYLEIEKEANAHEAAVRIVEIVEEHSARRSRQAVAKHAHSSPSAGGSSRKKARRSLKLKLLCKAFLS